MEINIPTTAAAITESHVVATKKGEGQLHSKANPPKVPRKNGNFQHKKEGKQRVKNKTCSQREKLEEVSGFGEGGGSLEEQETKEEEDEAQEEGEGEAEGKHDDVAARKGKDSFVKTICQPLEVSVRGEDEGEWVLLQDQSTKNSFSLNVCTGDAYWKPRHKAKRIVQRFDNDEMNEIWITLKRGKSLRPMFSAILSPRSIRRRLRRLFIDNNPHGLAKVEGLLEEHLYNSQDKLLHAVESTSTTFSSESMDAFCATAEQGIRFAAFAEQIRTDTSGRVLGCDLVKVKEEAAHVPSPRRMKRKRRVKRMSKVFKQQMFEWREDLKPARKKKGMTLQHLQKLSKCRAACPVAEYNPGLPIWPPTEREELLLAQQVFYSSLETPSMKPSSTLTWRVKGEISDDSTEEADVQDQEVSHITSNRSGNDEHCTRDF